MRSKFILLGLLLSFSCFGQKKNEIIAEGIRSIVVTEQKVDGTTSRTYKESETLYDKKGNIIEETLYKDGKFDTHLKYQYDALGNKIKETELGSDGKVKKVTDYKYQGTLRTEKTVTDNKGKIKSKKTYKYEKY
jgi:antitoxin component YwqK of YwqJK toxin-antitoxin module